MEEASRGRLAPPTVALRDVVRNDMAVCTIVAAERATKLAGIKRCLQIWSASRISRARGHQHFELLATFPQHADLLLAPALVNGILGQHCLQIWSVS